VIRTLLIIIVLAIVIIAVNRFAPDGTQERLARRRLANSTSQRMHDGQRVEVLLDRGEADTWYAGTAFDGGRVTLDDNPHGPPIAEPADITDWRPLP
jgi:hypothetical protein